MSGFVALLLVTVLLALAGVAVRQTGTARTVRTSGTNHDDWTPLARELDRARRYDHELALLQLTGQAIEVDDTRLRTEDGPVGQLVLRRTDTVWGGPDRVQILVPELASRQLEGMLQRLHTALDAGVEVRVACFPDDGLTVQALVEALRTPAPASTVDDARATTRRRRPVLRTTADPALPGAREAS